MDLIDAELRRSREDFIVHFKQTYSDPYPPAWIMAEVLPFGVITNIFSNIKVARIKKRISQKFGLQVAPFESWLTIIALTRNSCCHHARVWNKQNTIRPMLPNRMSGRWITLQTDPMRTYFDLCIIKYLLNVIFPQNDMTDKLKTLLIAYPGIDAVAMGFPDEIRKSVFREKSEQIVNPNKYPAIPTNRLVIDDKCSDFIYRPNAA